MSATEVDRVLEELREEISQLDSHFLASHIASAGLGVPSVAEQLDVAAFAVLSHGLFERFVERLAKVLSERLAHRWQNGKEAVAGTAAFLLHEKPPAADPTRRVYDLLRESLDQARDRMAGAINKNNGIAKDNLAGLFHPLGVDLPEDAVIVSQVEQLIAWRHEWAHRSEQGAQVARSAGDARSTMKDCLAFADALANNVRAAWPPD